MAERVLRVALESALQPCDHLVGRARPASRVKTLRDFGACMEAREKRQIVRHDPPEHEARSLQPVCAVGQRQCEEPNLWLVLRRLQPVSCIDKLFAHSGSEQRRSEQLPAVAL